MCKFGSFRTTFATITSLFELYLRIKRLILLVQTKKVISMNCGSSTSSWKPWRSVRLDLIISLRDIYINSNLNPLTKLTSRSRSTELKDILPWNISQMIMKTIPISTRIVITYAMKWGIPLGIWWKANALRQQHVQQQQQHESHCRTNTCVRRKKSKRAGLQESQSEIRVGKLNICVTSLEIEKL